MDHVVICLVISIPAHRLVLLEIELDDHIFLVLVLAPPLSQAPFRLKLEVCLELTPIELAVPQSGGHQAFGLLEGEGVRAEAFVHQGHAVGTVVCVCLDNLDFLSYLKIFVHAEGKFVRVQSWYIWCLILSLIYLTLIW